MFFFTSPISISSIGHKQGIMILLGQHLIHWATEAREIPGKKKLGDSTQIGNWIF